MNASLGEQNVWAGILPMDCRPLHLQVQNNTKDNLRKAAWHFVARIGGVDALGLSPECRLRRPPAYSGPGRDLVQAQSTAAAVPVLIRDDAEYGHLGRRERRDEMRW